MKPELTITIQKDNWVVVIGEHGYDIAPVSLRFLALVESLRKNYPEFHISLDPDAFENPYISRHVKVTLKWGLAPLYQDIDKMLAYPEPKTCNICGEKAWYNASVGAFQCTGCSAIESMIDSGRFFKVRRRK